MTFELTHLAPFEELDAACLAHGAKIQELLARRAVLVEEASSQLKDFFRKVKPTDYPELIPLLVSQGLPATPRLAKQFQRELNYMLEACSALQLVVGEADATHPKAYFSHLHLTLGEASVKTTEEMALALLPLMDSMTFEVPYSGLFANGRKLTITPDAVVELTTPPKWLPETTYASLELALQEACELMAKEYEVFEQAPSVWSSPRID